MGSSKVLVPRLECFEAFRRGQLGTLTARGCPDWIVEYLEELKDPVLEELMRRFRTCRLRPGRVPALPVIPTSILSARHQMEWVVSEWRKGTSDLTESKLGLDPKVARGRRPVMPYYVFDVEDGRNFLGMSMATTLLEIERAERVPLNVAQGIALAIHAAVLTHHTFDLPAERYGTVAEEVEAEGGRSKRVIEVGQEVPLMCIMAGQPKLIHDAYDRGGFAKRGVPSRAVTVVA